MKMSQKQCTGWRKETKIFIKLKRNERKFREEKSKEKRRKCE